MHPRLVRCGSVSRTYATSTSARGFLAAQGRVSGYPGTDVFCEHTMNQGLVADIEALGLGAESVQHLGVQTDGNELSSLAPNRRAADTAHRAQLLVGQLGNVGEVNLRPSDRAPFVPCGSLAAR